MKITFLGAGAYGTALESIALYNGHETKFYDPIKFPDINLESAISGADAVVYCAPSDQAGKILPLLDIETPLICASKGFLSEKPFEKFKNFSVLSGAGFAKDIKAALDIADEKASSIRLTGTSHLIERVFSTEKIIIEYTSDRLGVLLCGALKNIYAIGAGYHSSDFSPAYLESILSEMIDILTLNGADKNTLRLSCGISDLILSCNADSRNFRYGESLKTHASGHNSQPSNVQKTKSKSGKPLVEGVSAIMHLADYPDFTIPATASILKDIVKLVKGVNAAK